MLKVWFIPTRSGDYRLEANGAGSVLTVQDPTPSELAQLRAFLGTLRDTARPVIAADAAVASTGASRVEIDLPISLAAKLLVTETRDETWTAVRSTGGKIELLTQGVETAAAVVEARPEAVAAVTVTPPGRGCPAPVRCNYRASEVLRTFTFASQWNSWTRRGYLHAVGNLSGRRYTVLHRDLAAQRGLAHSVLDDHGEDLCVWDDRVPAEEEALAIKLTIEHNEAHILERHGSLRADAL